MKILAFAGSNSHTSINKKLVQYAVSLLPDTSTTELVDINDYEAPLFSLQRKQSTGIPEKITQFAEKIDACDLILISLAEYNGAYTSAFKNLFDWLSLVPNRATWGNKDMILLATSPGPRGGASVLEIAKNRFPYNGGTVVATFSLPEFDKHFETDKGITHPELNQKLIEILNSVFEEFTHTNTQ